MAAEKILYIRTERKEYGSFWKGTQILNMEELAKDLGRSPYYTTLFIACELGVASMVGEQEGVYFVNGFHDIGLLIQIINNFIIKFIDCYNRGCHRTELIVSETNVALNCGRCGFVSEVDSGEKVAATMIADHIDSREKVEAIRRKLTADYIRRKRNCSEVDSGEKAEAIRRKLTADYIRRKRNCSEVDSGEKVEAIRRTITADHIRRKRNY